MATIIFTKLIFLACLLYCSNTASIPILALQSEGALSFNFSGFVANETDGIHFVSDGTVSDEVVHLTNSTNLNYTNLGDRSYGRIVYNKTFQLSSIVNFSTHFRFAMNYSPQLNDSNDYGGDGIAFFMASKGDALSVPQLTSRGWFGLPADGRSAYFAVAFASADSAVGTFDKDSYNSYLQTANFAGLNNGALWDAWIDYNRPEAMLKVYLTNGSDSQKSHQNCILSQCVDLSEYFTKNIVVGLSSGAVNSSETHDIFSWSFNSSLYSKNSSIVSTSIQNRTSDGKCRKKVSSFTKILLSVGSGVLVCNTGALL